MVGRPIAGSASVIVAAMGLASCESTQTSVIVVIETDMNVPEELGRIRARVGATRVFDFVLDDDLMLRPPFSFAIVPEGDDPTRPLSIILEAFDPQRTRLFDLTTETGFREGSHLRLPLFLAGECRQSSCPARQTCTLGGCRPIEIAASSLEAIEPGTEI